MTYILVFLLGFLVSGLWFFLHIQTQRIVAKSNREYLQGFEPMISGIVPALIFAIVFHYNFLNYRGFLSVKAYLIGFVTTLVTSLIIILFTSREAQKDHKKLSLMCIEAINMEIPQRAMMQTFIMGLLLAFSKDSRWAVLITALIWCMDILVQCFIFKRNDYKEIMVEILASFIFSMGIGYVFYLTGCIFIPMIFHGLERYLTNLMDGRLHSSEKK